MADNLDHIWRGHYDAANVGRQQAKDPHAERKALEKALASYDELFGHSRYTTDGAAIVEAARKHLDTLPKPTKWRVTHIRNGETCIWNEFDNKGDAQASATRALQIGRRCVSVEEV